MEEKKAKDEKKAKEEKKSKKRGEEDKASFGQEEEGTDFRTLSGCRT